MPSDTKQVSVSIRSAFRPNRVMLLLSLVCAVVFGTIGGFVYLFSTCLGNTQDCMAYDRFGVAVAYVLEGPLLLLGWLASQVRGTTSDASGPFRGDGWVAVMLPILWAYYYVILALVRAFRAWMEVRNAPPSLK